MKVKPKWKILSDDTLREILENAKNNEGSTLIECKTYNDAVSLRANLLKYIKADKDCNSEIYPPGHDLHSKSYFEELQLGQSGQTIIIKRGTNIKIVYLPSDNGS